MGTLDSTALRNAALSLSEEERARLARDLVASLDGPADKELSAAWDIEICRRINEIESGKATLLSPKDVLTRARARIRS